MNNEYQNYSREYPLSVLYIEDNRLDQIILEKYMEFMGYTVILCPTAVEGIAALKAIDFDLIFMDIRLPKINGIEATKIIRNLEKEQNKFPSFIVGVTSAANEIQRAQGLEVGMNDFYEKSLTIANLARVVENAFVFRARAFVD